MRVIWKDSKVEQYKALRYRGRTITGSPAGWITDVPGDMNVYKSSYCAKNAVDVACGDFGEHGTAKRIAFGVQIIGQKNKSEE